jgi:hypothetical protein
MFLGVAGDDYNLGFVQRREHAGVGTCSGELATVCVRGMECQAPRVDFIDNVFVERIARDECQQFKVSERLIRVLGTTENHAGARDERNDDVPLYGRGHGFTRRTALQA